MRRSIAVILFLMFFVVGCAESTNYFVKDYEVGQQKEAAVGSVMISWESGYQLNDTDKPEPMMKTARPFRGSGIRRELVYSGADHDTLHLAYREYDIHDKRVTVGFHFENEEEAFARPAFGQDLKYDLSASRRITFQDIKINVENADQDKIVFTVIEAR